MVAEDDDDVASERGGPLFSFPTRPLSLRCNFSKASRAAPETIRINSIANGNNNAFLPKEEITDNCRLGVEIP